ncbi:MAG: hypothetical protein LBI17_02440 [Rickettsiales bacterium]|jgi:hypothetical protein|nr:hypothetical protein [Rickettsiales bacterium]
MLDCLPIDNVRAKWELVQGYSGKTMTGGLTGGYTYKIVLKGGGGGYDRGGNLSDGKDGAEKVYYVPVVSNTAYTYGIGEAGCSGVGGGHDCAGGGSTYITIGGTKYAADGGRCGDERKYAGGTNGGAGAKPSDGCGGGVANTYTMDTGKRGYRAITGYVNGASGRTEVYTYYDATNGNIAIYRLQIL